MDLDRNIVLETISLSKKIGRRQAVDSIDLKVYQGDIFGFLGPNGAGKSTTIRMITGLISPTEGIIRINNQEINHHRQVALRKSLRALIEYPRFYEYLTAVENLQIMAQLSGLKSTSSAIDIALNQVGLYDRKDDKVGSYSQGMKQRLGIAQAIMGEPDLVILDEPTNGLDPEGINEMRELIISLNQSKGITFFISSHLLKEIEAVCNRVAILNEGRLLAQDYVSELLKTPEHVYKIQVYPVIKATALLHTLSSISSLEQAKNDNNTLYIKASGLNPEDLNSFLVENGVKVSSLSTSFQTLEELFLSLTQKKEVAQCSGLF